MTIIETDYQVISRVSAALLSCIALTILPSPTTNGFAKIQITWDILTVKIVSCLYRTITRPPVSLFAISGNPE